MASLSKRDLILRARKREKIKWLVFDCIAKQRMQFQLPPFNMNDPAIDTASQQVINEVLPQGFVLIEIDFRYAFLTIRHCHHGRKKE